MNDEVEGLSLLKTPSIYQSTKPTTFSQACIILRSTAKAGLWLNVALVEFLDSLYRYEETDRQHRQAHPE